MEPVPDIHIPAPLLMRVLRAAGTATQTGLTFPCLLLLCEMAADPEASPEALALRMGVTVRGARSMIARLISSGCLRVLPGSGRPCRRELTPRGQSIIAALNAAAMPLSAPSFTCPPFE